MKRTIENVSVGLERLSAMLTVFGAYASWNKCETDEAIVSAHVINNAYDMMADYADMLAKQLDSISSEKSDDL